MCVCVCVCVWVGVLVLKGGWMYGVFCDLLLLQLLENSAQ